MARYKLVIFDFDGTLADSFPWFLGALNQVAGRYRFRKVEAHEVDTLRGYSGRQLLAHFRVPFWKMPFIARHMRALAARSTDTIRLFSGVDELLRELSDQGVELAIVSSNAEENIRAVLGPERAALIRYYECGTSLFGKAARFRRVLQRSGVRPGEALCIGDEIRDLEAARAVGIPSGAVSWGYATPEALKAHAPAKVFERVGDIAALVAGR